MRRVAIIGAGFGGLAVANYLNIHGRNDGVVFQILESKEKPVKIIGTFVLPWWMRNVLKELKISIPNSSEGNSSSPSDPIVISRQELLALLRKNITIQYQCHVERVVKKKADKGIGTKYYIYTCPNKTNSPTKIIGPFDFVIAANGLSFGEKHLSPSWKEDCTAVIGDSRWYQSLWWDLFGMTRIQRGGAIAMLDGLNLGQKLILQLPLNEFAASQQKTRRGRRQFLWVMLVLTILSIILFGSNKSNK